MRKLFLLLFLLPYSIVNAQLIVPNTGSNSYTVCSGVLYDAGGQFGNYSNNANGFAVLNPSVQGNMVQVSGSMAGESCCDFVRIYNGAGLTGNLLWEGNPGLGTIPTITSTAGPLTVQFTSDFAVVGSGFAININCVPPSTFTVPSTGNNEYTVCSGVLYDSGGPSGDYSNNANGFTVLNPSNPGYMMQISGSASGESCCDFIRIYNGSGLGGNLLWAGNPSAGVIPVITSTDGPLTVEFTSNGSIAGSGFALDLRCVPRETFIVPSTGNNAYTVCSGMLYDAGGPVSNYSNNSNGFTVLNPSNPGNMIQISGSMAGESCCDFVRIYNGAGLTGNLLWEGNPGVGTLPTITSTAGPLTVQFTSDGSVNGIGFAFNINCVPPSTFTVPSTGNNEYTLCSGVLYDSGGPSGNYSNNSSGFTVLNPSNPGYMMQISGSASGESCCDFIRIYNGSGLGGNLLWAGNPSAGVIPVITSTDGPLTVEFTSNGSNTGAGFALDLRCVPKETFLVPSSGNNAYTVCSGILYDAGGQFGNYSDNFNGFTVLNPSNPGAFMQVSGSIAGENCCDFLRIFDGAGLTGTLLWEGVAGFGNIPLITSLSGPLTVQFTSDGSVTGAGFALSMNCLDTNTCTPTIFISSNVGTSVCEGQLVTFSAAVSNGGPSPTYQWKRNGIAVGTAPSYVSAANSNGDVITCELTSNANCATVNLVSSNPLALSVSAVLSPTFTQVPPICAGSPLSPLPTTSNNNISGSWSPAIDNFNTTTYTFSPAAGQCGTSATMTITVNPNITPSFAQVGPFCAGQPISALPDLSINGIAGTWSPFINNNVTTLYTFLPNAGQCAIPVNTLIEIDPNPVVDLSFNGSVLITNPGFSVYTWSLNGELIEGANGQELEPISTGLYSVTVVDENGCSGSASFNLQSVDVAGVGNDHLFNIYPNPSQREVSVIVTLHERQQLNLRVLDLQGKILHEQPFTAEKGKNELNFDLGHLPDGIYFMQLENENMNKTKRLVKISN